MSTGDRFVNIYLKKFLPQQQFVDNFQLLLQKFTETLYTRIFPESGVFRGGLFASTAVDTFDISTPLEGSNSEGKDLVFDASIGTQVPFENLVGVDYFIGLQVIEIPNSIEKNVRTGKLKYVFDEEAIGERADPNLVVGARKLTIVPTQALYMMNSSFVIGKSKHAAKRILDRPVEQRVSAAYELILGRLPHDDEREFISGFLQQTGPDDFERTWARICQTLICSAEFRTLY